jgi:hypothetical protein
MQSPSRVYKPACAQKRVTKFQLRHENGGRDLFHTRFDMMKFQLIFEILFGDRFLRINKLTSGW